VEEIEHNSNCVFVIQNSRIEIVTHAYRHIVCFDFETKNM